MGVHALPDRLKQLEDENAMNCAIGCPFATDPQERV